MGDSTLRSKKAVFIRPSITCEPFKWIGKGSYAGGTRSIANKLASQQARDPYSVGGFRPIAVTPRSQSSNGTAFPVTMKEEVGAYIYGLTGAFWDVDIRTILCGYTLNPSGWDMIKRIPYSTVQGHSVDQESAYSPDAEGESLITVDMSSAFLPCMIYRVESREYNITDLYNLTNTSTLNRSIRPKIDVRYGDEWVISIVDNSDFGVMWGSDILNMTLGRLNISTVVTNISAADRIVMAVDVLGRLWISHNTGDGFILQHNPSVLGTGDFTAILVESFASCWLTTDDSYIYKSADGGKTLERITQYTASNYSVVEIVRSLPDRAVYFSDNVVMGVSMTDEDIVQRMVEYVVYDTSDNTNMIHSDGILFLGGKDVDDQPILVMSLDDGLHWSLSFRLLNMSVVTEYDNTLVIMPASNGNGVVWLVVLYDESTGYLLPAIRHCDIYRSVYYGLPGTWKLEWSHEVSLGGESAFGMFPTDISAMSVNRCMVVGLWVDWLDPLSIPDMYAVELFSSEERND